VYVQGLKKPFVEQKDTCTTFEANTKAEANLTNIKLISEELFKGLDHNFLSLSKWAEKSTL